jgi:hypothetical protein
MRCQASQGGGRQAGVTARSPAVVGLPRPDHHLRRMGFRRRCGVLTWTRCAASSLFRAAGSRGRKTDVTRFWIIGAASLVTAVLAAAATAASRGHGARAHLHQPGLAVHEGRSAWQHRQPSVRRAAARHQRTRRPTGGCRTAERRGRSRAGRHHQGLDPADWQSVHQRGDRTIPRAARTSASSTWRASRRAASSCIRRTGGPTCRWRTSCRTGRGLNDAAR